jgi:hypothetical protein
MGFDGRDSRPNVLYVQDYVYCTVTVNIFFLKLGISFPFPLLFPTLDGAYALRIRLSLRTP